MNTNSRFDTIKRFTRQETFSSVLLFACALLSIIWANSRFSASYFGFLHTDIGFTYMHREISQSVSHWINDGLMVVFFFLIGLEIKREMLEGELSSVKKASLSVIAALGGVLVPMFIFMFIAPKGEAGEGWAIPMATDIAFSLGILLLLGKRVPISLKIFLAAFAIVDDICAVVVISIFYSNNISWMLLGIALFIFALMLLLAHYKMYNGYVFFVLGLAIWLLFLGAGIHPTVAGVMIAFTIPTNRVVDTKKALDEMGSSLEGLVQKNHNQRLLTKEEINWVSSLRSLTNKIMPPSQRLEHNLHGPVAYFILPLFALANAGVSVMEGNEFNFELFNEFSFTIAVSLIAGKIIGITSFSWLAIKAGIANYPYKTTFKHLLGISILGGFGFTMSLFINNLALDDAALKNSGKLGIICGSFIAGISGYLYLRYVLRNENHESQTEQN